MTLRIDKLVSTIADEQHLLLNHVEQQRLTSDIVNDMIGLGPL